MVFDINKWNYISSGKNTLSFNRYSYQTDDTFADVADIGGTYFAPKGTLLKENDVIDVITEISTSPTYTKILVEQPLGPKQVSVKKIHIDNSETLVVYQYIESKFFTGVSDTLTSIVAINDFEGASGDQERLFTPISFESSFVGDILPGDMSLEVGIDGIIAVPLNYIDSDSPYVRKITNLVGLPDVSPGSVLTITKKAGVAQTEIEAFHCAWILKTL